MNVFLCESNMLKEHVGKETMTMILHCLIHSSNYSECTITPESSGIETVI